MTIPLREFDSFFRVTTWQEWLAITRTTFHEYLIPWLVSNLVGLVLLMIAFRAPKFCRKVWGLLLLIAGIVNTYIVLTDPTAIHEFGVVSIPPMQRFIYSKYFSHPAHLILPLALCQGLTGIELLYGKSSLLRKVALTSAIAFFLGIATFGVDSAFPSSLLYAMTMKRCWPKEMKLE